MLNAVQNFARELRILSRISHPNVLNFLGYALLGEQHYYIVSEWMERGDLKNCIMVGLTVLELFEMVRRIIVSAWVFPTELTFLSRQES